MSEEQAREEREKRAEELLSAEVEEVVTPDPEPETEPEPTPEPDEPDSDEEPQVEPEQVADEPEPEPDFNAELREQQHRLIEAQRKAAETWENAVNRFKNNPTDQNAAAAHKAKSKLDELLEQSDDDIDPYQATKVIGGEVKNLSEKLSDENIDRMVNERVERKLREFQTVQVQHQQARSKFEQEHGVTFTDYEAAVRQELAGIDGKVSDEAWSTAVNAVTPYVIERLKSAKVTPKDDPPPKTEVKKPIGTNPVKTKASAPNKKETAQERDKRMESLLVIDSEP